MKFFGIAVSKRNEARKVKNTIAAFESTAKSSNEHVNTLPNNPSRIGSKQSALVFL